MKPGEVVEINAMYFKSRCPLCERGYVWHREHKNVCPHCGGDFGYLITLDEFRKRIND